MRPLQKLSATFVKSAPPGKHNDGGGLWFFKRPDGGGQWVMRVTVHGRRREMGLGRFPDVSLKRARELAASAREVSAQGLDPIKEREKWARRQARADTTLRRIAEEAFEARKSELKGDGKAGRWFSPLEIHILPKLGKVPVEELDQRDLRDALVPIWHTKADTARKATNRLNIVLKHAAALGLDVDLQVVEKAKALLGKSRHKASNIPAIPWREVPAFYATLDELTTTHLALRMLILTGMRSGPIRFMRSDQIDGDVWTIPAERMKGGRDRTADFRVPLSREALQVVELAAPLSRDGFLFPSPRKEVISDATMSRHMERRGMDARPHGFRTSLRTWLAETTDAPHEVAETMLAHVSDGAVVRAYRRTDYLDQRRVLIERWGDFVAGRCGQAAPGEA